MTSGRPSSRNFSRSEARDVLSDPRTWCSLGIVVKRSSNEDHFEIIHDDAGAPVDVVVEVSLMPRKESVSCRLAALAGGPGSGLWRIPPVGTEVYVAIPGGEVEGGPLIVATLSSRDVPAGLDKDTMVLINPGKIFIASKDDKVYIGSPDGSGTKAIAFKDGRVDLGRFIHVPAGGVGVSACSLSWLPSSADPTGPPPLPPPTGTVIGPTGAVLTGNITDGSPKAEVKT